MSRIVLSTPICEEELKKLRIGDVFFLTGELATGRDDVHRRVVREQQALPADLNGKAIFHAGPIMKQRTDGGYDVVSVGPTTSMRMEAYESEFIEKTGVRLMIGKGGMGEKTAEACRRLGAVHAVFPGGCAVLAAGLVEAVDGVEWLDLGMPEAVWRMRVKAFGPLIVSIDTQGANLFERNQALFRERKEAILPGLCARAAGEE